LSDNKSLYLLGREAVIEGLSLGLKPKQIFLVNSTEGISSIPCPVIQVNTRQLRRLTGVKSPPDIVAEYEWEERDIQSLPQRGRFVYLDRIRDPGNMGTILRTCWAAQVSGVLISQECVSLYNPKVFRASRGSYFFLNIAECISIDELKGFISERGLRVYIALPRGGEYCRIEMDSLLVMGGETLGISKEIEGLADVRVSIPMNQACESLNVSVALGILLYAG